MYPTSAKSRYAPIDAHLGVDSTLSGPASSPPQSFLRQFPLRSNPCSLRRCAILAAFGAACEHLPPAQGAGALAGHRGHRDCHGAVATGASRGSQSQPHGCGSSVARNPRTAPIGTPAAAAAAAPATHDFLGVSYKGNANTHGAKWQASASVRGGTQSLGCFSTAEAAAEAYDRCIVSERRLGVGRTNFPLSNYLSIFNSASLPVLYS